ncbi:steroid receptor RNA activator 1-like [Dermacentor andersoni]|uniref:steroid receptor RNA activator 1-like n=1 Tax=Dermacentor andersoni TaxID=34620 RepID=UPI002155B7A6|nr:steroid receptor RNA activator 1-like [Dermacentor andersoni]
MAALRPGNDDKAWNDPPVFAYTDVQGTPAAAAPKRNLLNKRVPFPQDGIKPQNAPSATGTAPPPSGQATSSGLFKAAHSGNLTEASNKADQKEAEEVNDSPKATPACSPENIKEETLSNLNKAARQYAQNMEKRKQDDVKKRLDLFKSVWEEGKLSLPVQQRMHELALELLNGNHEKANALHVSLMVDYVSEVSQWMLGIKHLILAAQAAQEKPASEAQEST